MASAGWKRRLANEILLHCCSLKNSALQTLRKCCKSASAAATTPRGVVEADLELSCNSSSAGFLRERL